MAANMIASSRCGTRVCLRHFRILSQRNFRLFQHSSRANHSISSLSTPHSYVKRSKIYNSKGQLYFHTSSIRWEATTVNCPPFADSVTEGDIRWEKAVGDTVSVDDVIGEVETDKTALPVVSPVSGTITALLVEDGTTVTPGTALVTVEVGEVGSSSSSSSGTPVTPAPDAQPAPEKVEPVDAQIPTTAPPPPPVPTSPMKSTPAADVKPKAAELVVDSSRGQAGSRSEERVKMNRMRQRIAQRLKDAQNTCAMLTTFNEIDMSNVMELRSLYKDAFFKKHGVKLGFMSAFVRAAAFALTDQPIVNAVIDGTDIVYRDYVDISVAVSTPKGLVVPVLRNVENLNYAQIEKNIEELGVKARDGLLAVEDMDGGTFTISNGGVFGSVFGTPIINPPQSAILGMHGIFDRPVAVKGQVEIRPMMYVALTYDHRLVDGREAVTFLRKIKSAVEDPRVLLIDL